MGISLRGPLARLGLGNRIVAPLRVSNPVSIRTALPGRLAARRARAVARPLIEPFVGKLQVREQLHGEPLQWLRAERGERIGITSGLIVFAQLHAGASATAMECAWS